MHKEPKWGGCLPKLRFRETVAQLVRVGIWNEAVVVRLELLNDHLLCLRLAQAADAKGVYGFTSLQQRLLMVVSCAAESHN